MDKVEHPSHYQGSFGIEAVDVIRNFATVEMEQGFYWGNVIKYLTRWKRKNQREDLEKAKVYLDWLLESIKENE